MKSIFANKKLLLALIVVLVGAGIGGVVLYKYKIQKPPTPLISPTLPGISPEAVKAKCLEDVSKMNEEQLIEKINTPVSPETVKRTVEYNEYGKEIGRLMSKYLVCNFILDPTEENYNKTKENFLKLRLSDESRKVILAGLETIYSKRQEWRDFVASFSALLATKKLEFLCPQGKQTPQLVEKCLAEVPKSLPDPIKSEFCNTLCERLDKYSKDTEVLKKEILNFTNWSEWTKDWGKDYAELKASYLWRVAVAYRFGDKDAALKVCENLPRIQKVRDDCISQVEKLQKINCGKIFKDLTVVICQLH